MSEFFNYSSSARTQFNPETVEGPIWSDFSSSSEHAKMLVRAKQVNDENYWNCMREVFDHDCDTLPMSRFKAWVSVWNVPLMSMSRHSVYIKEALTSPPQIQDLIQDPGVGCNRQDLDQYLKVFSENDMTMNRIQHYGHLKYFQFKPKDYKTIVELGAGVGDMADLVYKLGFNGTYSIFDFTEVSRIQRYYHDALGHTDITYTDNADDLEPADLCIATWSLTEMPFDLRDQILDKIGTTKTWLIAYSRNIFGYDNEKWINEIFLKRSELKNAKTTIVDIPWMDWDGGTKYLFVERV